MADFLAGLGVTCSPAGPIRTSSFVCLDPVQPDIFQVRQATAATADGGDLIIGIAQQGTDNAPNLQNSLYGGGTTSYPMYAATPGEPVTTFSLGDIAPLTLGVGGATAGALLTCDGSGFGIMTPLGSKVQVGAVALQPGNQNDIILVQSLNRKA